MKIVLLITLIVFSLSCSKNVLQKQEKVIDPIVKSPYTFEFNPNVTLPDSLGGEKYKGYAWIEGDINDSLKKVVSVRIIRLYVFNQKGDTVVHYYYGQDSLSIKYIYPSTVQKFIPFFQESLQSVKITKIQEGNVDKKVKYSVRLNFKSPLFGVTY